MLVNTCPWKQNKIQESKAENNKLCCQQPSAGLLLCHAVEFPHSLGSSQLGGRYTDNHTRLSFSPFLQRWSLSEEAHLQEQRRFPALCLRRCTAFGVTGRMRSRRREKDCNKVWERWNSRWVDSDKKSYRWRLFKVCGKMGLKIYTKGKWFLLWEHKKMLCFCRAVGGHCCYTSLTKEGKIFLQDLSLCFSACNSFHRSTLSCPAFTT